MVYSGTEGLLVLLKRFPYIFSCRLSDMIPHFARSVPELSLILNQVIYTNHVLSIEREQLLRIAGGLSMGQFAQSVTQERTSV